MTDRHETLTQNELVDDLDRKFRLARPIEELRDDPDLSREHLLCAELIALAGDDGLSDREGQKLQRALMEHFAGEVGTALAALADGDVSLDANGMLLIDGRKPRTIREAIQELVEEGWLAPTGQYRPRRDGKLEPVYTLTDKGRAEHLRNIAGPPRRAP